MVSVTAELLVHLNDSCGLLPNFECTSNSHIDRTQLYAVSAQSQDARQVTVSVGICGAAAVICNG